MQDNTGALRMEFHISRQARDRYHFDASLFALSGNVILPDFHAARVFAQRMNEHRDLVNYPEQAVKAGQINAMGLIDELLHLVVAVYREQKNPAAMKKALEWLYQEIGVRQVDEALRRFADEFPCVPLYRREISLDAYLEGTTGGTPNREVVLEEMLLLWLANVNLAFSPFLELFDDAELSRATAYLPVMDSLYQFFQTQPTFGPDNQNLIDMLRSPALAMPHSLTGQLEYIRERWGQALGRHVYRLLRSLDLIAEEEKPVFAGPGPAQVVQFADLAFEPERFSPDLDWMPKLVLMAKNTYVWLDQLSRQYGRSIIRLDEVPDAELDRMARWGLSGLWLIGLWERSPASRKAKQLCGNPEAVASAYSVYDYQIATDLGGDAAYAKLRERAWLRGIRMASDMVPNHVGVYSRWVVEHPEWFISLEHSPFPSYSFTGPDLSEDQRVGIFLEDHYYDRSDAAVVFKRVDRWTGSEAYIYHGNDGTSMPWNDTAQLNYLRPDLREAVIQTILHVARQFPIIRFDAAMTLTKRHYQRLWFPEPGTGGAIPTRAEHGLSREQFDAAMPEEFWREVVDRVAHEAPDTLLLAEAFWLLEGYFVRTLGMHRVYNSAFMNMLRDEENAKYRSVMKNTLEFDPEILKRFVSFMNNPDEETAVAQFGKGDKYFGICTLLATLPGLPMFGHGQIEGLAEKYGMEYRRAYWDEQPDPHLVERHEREIFPLLHLRYLFAEVEHFLLYDFFSPEGSVNEDVFAFSNRAGDERALVVYHNRFGTARGWVRTSVAYSAKTGDSPDASLASGSGRRLVQRNLGQGLGLCGDGNRFCIFRDHATGLEYIRSSRELCESGLYVELGAYKCHVFLDWHEVEDNQWGQYAHLAAYLNGRGVPSTQEALQEAFLQPVHQPFRALVNAELFRKLMQARATGAEDERLITSLLDQVEAQTLELLRAVQEFTHEAGPVAPIAREIRRRLEVSLGLAALDQRFPLARSRNFKSAVKLVVTHMGDDVSTWGSLFGWLFVHALGRTAGDAGATERSRSWIDEWLLGRVVAGALQELGLDDGAAWWSVGVIKILTNHQSWYTQDAPWKERAYQTLVRWLRDGEVQHFLQVNRYQGVLWFNDEAFRQLMGWMLTLAAVELSADPERAAEEVAADIAACYGVVKELLQAKDASGFQVVKLLEQVRP